VEQPSRWTFAAGNGAAVIATALALGGMLLVIGGLRLVELAVDAPVLSRPFVLAWTVLVVIYAACRWWGGYVELTRGELVIRRLWSVRRIDLTDVLELGVRRQGHGPEAQYTAVVRLGDNSEHAIAKINNATVAELTEFRDQLVRHRYRLRYKELRDQLEREPTSRGARLVRMVLVDVAALVLAGGLTWAFVAWMFDGRI